MNSDVRTLDLRLPAGGYPILVSPGGLEGLIPVLRPWAGVPSALVTDTHVDLHHGEAAAAALRAAGVPHERFVLEPGEPTKSFDQLRQLLDGLLAAGVPRDGVVVALGGGVVGDLTALAASLLRRGVACVQVPTSLVAQVDSAIGGKTAINSDAGKNLVGTFHQPRAVFAATGVLATLPMAELRAGMGEVIKYALLDGEALAAEVEGLGPRILAREPAALARLVERCAAIKARIVEQDEQEGGRRRLLNLGHTVGHAVERAGGYGLLRHGEAVAIGLVAAAALSVELGLAAPALVPRVRTLLDGVGLPVRAPRLRRSAVLDALTQDKKASADALRWVLLRGIGEPLIRPEPLSRAEEFLEIFAHAGVLRWSSP
jgi:3-dehydroquinate synthase